jgi:hypothetical protein
MGRSGDTEKRRAHELIDRLPPQHASAVVGILEAILDPVARAMANAPIDDEPEMPEERQEVAESKNWFERRGGKGIPQDQVLSDFDIPHGKKRASRRKHRR